MKHFASLAAWVPGLLVDLFGLGGAGAAVYGIWMICHPAAFIIGGSLAAVGSYAVARSR